MDPPNLTFYGICTNPMEVYKPLMPLVSSFIAIFRVAAFRVCVHMVLDISVCKLEGGLYYFPKRFMAFCPLDATQVQPNQIRFHLKCL